MPPLAPSAWIKTIHDLSRTLETMTNFETANYADEYADERDLEPGIGPAIPTDEEIERMHQADCGASQ
jgi:hypothetical protein